MNIDLPIQWLKSTLKGLKWGTITLTFTLHDGRITKISRGVQESIKPVKKEPEK